jgi:hypothetical protein
MNAYFSRECESRKVSTCYRSKRAFGDLETFVTGELKSRAKSTLIEPLFVHLYVLETFIFDNMNDS